MVYSSLRLRRAASWKASRPRIATCRDRTARHSLGLDRGPLAKPHDAPCAPSSSAHRSRFSRMRNGLRPRRFLYAAASTVLQATLVTAALPITEGEDGEAIQGCGACRELVQRLLHANGREGVDQARATLAFLRDRGSASMMCAAVVGCRQRQGELWRTDGGAAPAHAFPWRGLIVETPRSTRGQRP
jgi:hypothetical protein